MAEAPRSPGFDAIAEEIIFAQRIASIYREQRTAEQQYQGNLAVLAAADQQKFLLKDVLQAQLFFQNILLEVLDALRINGYYVRVEVKENLRVRQKRQPKLIEEEKNVHLVLRLYAERGDSEFKKNQIVGERVIESGKMIMKGPRIIIEPTSPEEATPYTFNQAKQLIISMFQDLQRNKDFNKDFNKEFKKE